MRKNTEVADWREDSSSLGPQRVTRGLRREQEKRRRLKALVGTPLIVGVDLARENQALSYYAGEIVGRRRIRCAPGQICERVRAEAERLCEEHERERVLFAMEPAGHYWGLAAESIEKAGMEYVLVHPLAVKREREGTRYTPEKRDPRDGDLICELSAAGKVLEARLFSTRREAQMNAWAREYLLVRQMAAAEKVRLHNFWDRLLPEFTEVLREVDSQTALAIACALEDFTQLSALSEEQWKERVRAAAAGKRILSSRAAAVLSRIQAAHSTPHRRMTDALPMRIRLAAERRVQLTQQKQRLAEAILQLYEECSEAAYLDSIPGSHRLYNALTLGLVGDFRLYDDPRAIVKLAGSEVNEFASGDYRGRSRISHRGRNLLRAAAYQQANQLILNNLEYTQRYVHLQKRTTHPRLLRKQALVAVANSYLRTAHVLVTTKTLWAPARERETRGVKH